MKSLKVFKGKNVYENNFYIKFLSLANNKKFQPSTCQLLKVQKKKHKRNKFFIPEIQLLEL